MRFVLVHADGVTREADAVDPSWIVEGARETVWVNIDRPAEADRAVLQGIFQFHELAVEDALGETHHPKIESYDTFLYLILHGIGTYENTHGFQTQDIDFFLGPNYLVTVHTIASPSIETEHGLAVRHANILGEGAIALMHRIVDRMVDRYRPSVDALDERLDAIEKTVFENPGINPLKDILALKADVALLRRIALPQRDAVGRLARREFPEIPEAMAYRFRDVYDHLVRMTDEAAFFQDRVTSLLDAYLSTQSNRMNQVMKRLTLIATIFMPLTVLTGVWGMNVAIPHLPGPDGLQFWWLMGAMAVLSATMMWWFKRMDWL
jgi:magnesium transporter